MTSLRSRADKLWHFALAPPPAYELRHALRRRVRMRRGDGKPFVCMCDMLRLRCHRSVLEHLWLQGPADNDKHWLHFEHFST